nr:immunoglobulin light chain junction region [Macaca mulatta]
CSAWDSSMSTRLF